VKPNNPASGVENKMATRIIINIVANKRCFPGLLLNRGFLLLMHLMGSKGKYIYENIIHLLNVLKVPRRKAPRDWAKYYRKR
jgi:hypothetical protein